MYSERADPVEKCSKSKNSVTGSVLSGYIVAMRLQISHKLMLTFVGLTLLVLVATLGLARWSFERGFLDYVNALEQVRLERLAVDLEQEYLAAGNSWSELNTRHFGDLLRQQKPPGPGFAGAGPRRPPPPDIMPPPPEAPPPGHQPPPPEGHLRPGDTRPPGTHGFPPPRGAPPSGPPTALFDLDNQIIAGDVLPQDGISPIRVPVMADGQRVAELRSAPRRQFESPQETAFSRQQLITSLLIGALSLAMAIGVSLLLTRLLLAPIRRMMAGVSRLSNGDYATRLDESRTDELGQLMGNLDRLAHKLEENRTSRRRWLADISHELRTPVTVLTGEIESLKDGIRSLDMQQVFSFDQEVSRLRHLIEDLYELSVSDIGGLSYSFSPVDIRESMNQAVKSIRKRAAEKGIEFSLSGETEVAVNADTQRLDQLFSNLLENALAYTDAPGRIDIALSTSDGQLSIRIQDTPPGVSEEDCGKLFDPLHRQEASRSRRTAGAGLGLAICRNIVDAHQGTINASPSEMGGLCIHIVFPVLDKK